MNMSETVDDEQHVHTVSESKLGIQETTTDTGVRVTVGFMSSQYTLLDTMHHQTAVVQTGRTGNNGDQQRLQIVSESEVGLQETAPETGVRVIQETTPETGVRVIQETTLETGVRVAVGIQETTPDTGVRVSVGIQETTPETGVRVTVGFMSSQYTPLNIVDEDDNAVVHIQSLRHGLSCGIQPGHTTATGI